MGVVIFESRIRSAILAHLSRTVKFRNGQLSLRDNDPIIEELKKDPEYGTEYALLGELRNPTRFETVKVTRGASSTAPADNTDRIPAGRPRDPVEAKKVGRPPKDSTT